MSEETSEVGAMDVARRFRFVIFDMDGVLLDTEPLYTVAFDRVLAPFGCSLDRVTKAQLMGRPAAESTRIVLARYGLPLTPAEFQTRLRVAVTEVFADPPAMPGAPALIADLAARGVAMAVATSTARELFVQKTAGHPWFASFSVVVCGDDPEVAAPKPAPDIFLVAARRLGADPAACLIVEDSPLGLAAARAAGGHVVALVGEEDEGEGHACAHRRVRTCSELACLCVAPPERA